MERLKNLIKVNEVSEIKSFIASDHRLNNSDIKNKSFDLLIYAIKKTSSLVTIKTILENYQHLYKDLNYSLDNGESPLAVALSYNRFSLSDLLIEQFRADINYVNCNKETILFYLYNNKLLNQASLTYILNHDIDINVLDIHGKSFLSNIIIHNEYYFLRTVFLKFKSYSQDCILKLLNIFNYQIPVSTEDLKTLLSNEVVKSNRLYISFNDIIEVYKRQSLNFFKLYFETDISYDFFSNYNSVADLLCFLYQRNKIDKLKYLIDKGARLNQFEHLNRYDSSGYTLLYYTIIKDDVEIADYIIQKGAYINIAGKSKDWSYVLRYAFKSERMSKLLIKRGADLFISDREYNKLLNMTNVLNVISNYYSSLYTGNEKYSTFYSACKNGNLKIVKHLLQTNIPNIHEGLCYACRNGNIDIIKLLIEYGANVNYGNRPLEQACILGDEKVVKFLLEQGADPHQSSSCNKNYLMLARESNNAKVIELLLKYGVDNIYHKNKDNETLLIYACKNGYETIACDIMERDVDHSISSYDECGNSALFYASQTGLFKVVKFLIDHGADCNKKNKYSETPLIMASKYGFIDIVEYLMNHGADPNIQNETRETALIIACKSGYTEIIKYLMSHGADPTISDSSCKLPLMYALKTKNKEVVDYLLSNEQTLKIDDINSETWKNKKTLLMYACKYNFKNVIEKLVEHHVNLNKMNKKGETALNYACKYGNIDIVQYLIDQGANVDVITNSGDTILMYGILSGKREIVEILMLNEVDWKKRNCEGDTAMMYACKLGNSDIVEFLLDQGIDINVVNNYGDNPLIYACQYGHKNCVKLLLDCDCYIDSKGSKGKTALIHACEKGKIDIVKLLVSYGCNINVRDNQGKTALMYARDLQSDKIYKYLVESLERYHRKYDDDDDDYDEEEDYYDDYSEDDDYYGYGDFTCPVNPVSVKLNKIKKKKVKRFEKKYANDNTSIQKIVNIKYGNDFYFK